MLALMLVESNDWFTCLRCDKFGEKALGYSAVEFSYGTGVQVACFQDRISPWREMRCGIDLHPANYSLYCLWRERSRHAFFPTLPLRAVRFRGMALHRTLKIRHPDSNSL